MDAEVLDAEVLDAEVLDAEVPGGLQQFDESLL